MLLPIAPSATQCHGAPPSPTASTPGSQSQTSTQVSFPATQKDVVVLPVVCLAYSILEIVNEVVDHGRLCAVATGHRMHLAAH